VRRKKKNREKRREKEEEKTSLWDQDPRSSVVSFVDRTSCSLSLQLAAAPLLAYPKVPLAAAAVPSCYPRRTSRVSAENKRHVVYMSADEPERRDREDVP